MTLRVGVIGIGWGAHVQVPAFRAADGFDRVAGKLGIDDTSTDWETFVRRDDVDVISIATPTSLHAEMTWSPRRSSPSVRPRAASRMCGDVRSGEPTRRLPDGELMAVPADDTASVLLRMSSGVIAVLSISAIGAHADHYRIEVFGADGSIVCYGTLRATDYWLGAAGDESPNPLPVVEREPAHPESIPDGLAGHAIRAMALMLQDWLPAFDGGPSGAPTFDDGLLSLAIIEAAHRSRDGGGWVRVQT